MVSGHGEVRDKDWRYWDEQRELAAVIATAAHKGQTDKLGHDYIEHPMWVAAKIRFPAHPVEYCAALLHDVLEDSAITRADLVAVGVDRDVVEVVELLTRRTDENDPDDYYRRIRDDDRAFFVKLADLEDNQDPERVNLLPEEARDRLASKYAHARAVLGDPWFFMWGGEIWPNTWEEFQRSLDLEADPDWPFSSDEVRAINAFQAWRRLHPDAGPAEASSEE